MNSRFAAILGLAVTCITMAGSPCTVAPASDRAPLVFTRTVGLGVCRDRGGAEFLGIPYAEPPVGRLRWRAPVPVTPWRRVRAATTFGPQCAQPTPNGWKQSFAVWASEDCLYLNVIAPRGRYRKLLPVMFWIHGGET